MRPISAPSLVLLLITLFASGCGVLRHRQPLTWQLVVEIDNSVPKREEATEIAKTIIERRLNVIGVKDAKVSIMNEQPGRIEIQLPEVADRGRLKAFLTSGGKLELVHVISPPYPNPLTTYADQKSANLIAKGESNNLRVLPVHDEEVEKKQWAIVETPAIITNIDVRYASAFPADDGFYNVSFSLRNDGAQRFSVWTKNNINEYLGVVLNDEIKSTAFIKTQLFDSGVISGKFTKASAEDLAQILISGSFPAAIRVVEESKD